MENIKRSFMTEEEKSFLKDLVLQKSDVIESKKTDAISSTKKRKATVEIAMEFYSRGDFSNRNVEQLKKYWENIKSRRKKELSIEKRHRMATLGGSYLPPSQDGIDSIDTTIDIEIMDANDSDAILLYSAPEVRRPHDAAWEDHTYSTEVEIPKDVLVEPPSTNKVDTKSRKHFARGTAIEIELDKRLEQTEALKENDKELHQLKIHEQLMKNEEQQLRLQVARQIPEQEELKRKIYELDVEEQEIKVQTAKEILKQEKIKTAKLLN